MSCHVSELSLSISWFSVNYFLSVRFFWVFFDSSVGKLSVGELSCYHYYCIHHDQLELDKSGQHDVSRFSRAQLFKASLA